MRNILFSLLILSTALWISGCKSLWLYYLDCAVDVAPQRFTFEKNNLKCSIPVFTTHPLDAEARDVTSLIVVVHGVGLNARKSFATGEKIARLMGSPGHQTPVVAPQFLEGVDPDEKGLLLWDRKWRSGGECLSAGQNGRAPTVNSYEVMDRLIHAVTAKTPNLRQIRVFGHSAGGQFVARYGAVNDAYEDLVRKNVSILYVVANPSSYLYLDETRYQIDSVGEISKQPSDALTACQSFNTYNKGQLNLI